MISKLNNMPIEIYSMDDIPTNCGFTEIVAALILKPSNTGGLPKYLKLNLESKEMLTINLDKLEL